MHRISQSLAGRAAVLSLLPFSFVERIDHGEKAKEITRWIKELNLSQKCDHNISISDTILRGSYPEIASRPSVDRQLWCGSYISTYIEMDVRNLAQVGDLGQFERFLKLCAIRTGQILNLSELAKEVGMSVPTMKRWLSLLETGHQIYLLYPYYKNLGKRLVKSPKLYFNDTGLASYLLGLHDRETLLNSPNFSNLFETMIVIDFLKRFLHFGQMPSLYYLRTRDGLEVDLVLELGQKVHLFEIKSSMTILPKHASPLLRMAKELKSNVGICGIISLSLDNFHITGGVSNYSWKNILGL